MTAVPAIHSVSVSRTSQLEVGAYYLVSGTHRGFPLPPQVLCLRKKDINPTLSGVGCIQGILFWRMWNSTGVIHDHLYTLYDVNIPEHGDHDVHLERLDESLVKGVVGAKSFADVQQEIQQRIQKGWADAFK